MKVGEKDYSKRLFFIVEEGQFNLGNFDKALQMIEMVSKTGANAIEFQLAYADDFYIETDSGHGIYKTREFTDDQLQILVSMSHKMGLHFVATCLSHKLIDKMASMGADAFNINASDINNPAIVDAVSKTGLPYFISTPLATKKEISWVINRITEIGGNLNFVLLHGQHPMMSGSDHVEVGDTSLGVIESLNIEFQKNIGFIDHTPFYWMPAVAVAAGAQVVSKHMTLSHVYEGPDHAICLDPVEMMKAIKLANEVYASKAVRDKELAKGEDLDRTVMRRSIVSSKKIFQGQKISKEDILFKRPGHGISPDGSDLVVGKTAAVDIAEDKIITKEMLN
jgi:sialic acid synthase SpsE